MLTFSVYALVCLAVIAGIGVIWRGSAETPARGVDGIARLVVNLVGAALALLPVPVLGLLAVFACGDLRGTTPICTGRTALSGTGGWGSASNSPLWVPAVLFAVGLCLGAAMWLVATLRTRRRARWFLVAGQVIAFVSFGIFVVGLSRGHW